MTSSWMPVTSSIRPISLVSPLLEEHLNQRFNIKMIKNVKFLNVISPVERPQITYVFEKITVDDTTKTCQAQVQVLSDETSMVKLSFICSEQ